MKKIFLLLSICIFINSCTSKITNKHSLQINANIINKISPTELNEKAGNYYSIKISITNNTDTIVNYWLMTCSWQDNLIFNTNSICFYRLGCKHNFPTIKKLLPKESLVYNGIIQICDTSNYKNKKSFKLGFIFINKNEYFDLTQDYFEVLLDRKKNNKHIIWCDNPINLVKE